MNWRHPVIARLRLLLSLVVLPSTTLIAGFAQARGQEKTQCRVEPIDYHGWAAQQLSNQWVKLIFVPQNGGRLMQVSFAGHDYLFVNPEVAGKYLPPTSSQWFNYGGDKLWLLPD